MVLAGLFLIDVTQLYGVNVLPGAGSQSGKENQGTIRSVRDGLAYIFQTPSALLIIALIGAISLFGINYNVLLPLFASDVLRVGANGYGFISSAFGVGSLMSALWLAWKNRKPAVRHMLGGACVFAIAEIAFAVSHVFALSLKSATSPG